MADKIAIYEEHLALAAEVLNTLATSNVPPVVRAAAIEVANAIGEVLQNESINSHQEELIEVYKSARRWQIAQERQCWRHEKGIATAECTCEEDELARRLTNYELIETMRAHPVEVQFLGDALDDQLAAQEADPNGKTA